MNDQTNAARLLLLDALRQYRHNDSDEFVAGYEREETERIVGDLKLDFENSSKEGQVLLQRTKDAELKLAESDYAYDSSMAEIKRLVRELDVLLNGEDGAAQQASLCDIVGQVAGVVRERGAPLLSPAHIEDGEEVEVVGYRVSMPGEPELGTWLDEAAEEEPQIQRHEPLMTVAQHQRIVAGLQSEIAKLVLELKDSDEYGEREELRANRYSSELVELRAALSAPPAAGVPEDLREAVADAVAEALGEALDCTRVWSAWGVGTMSEDDFRQVADDPARVAEIADAAIAAMVSAAPAPPAAEQQRRENAVRYIQVIIEAERISALTAAITPPASEQQRAVVMPDAEWIDPVALCSCGPAYDAGWRDGVSEAKRLNAHLAKGEGVADSELDDALLEMRADQDRSDYFDSMEPTPPQENDR